MCHEKTSSGWLQWKCGKLGARMTFSIRVHLCMPVASQSLGQYSAYFCHLTPGNVSADITEE